MSINPRIVILALVANFFLHGLQECNGGGIGMELTKIETTAIRRTIYKGALVTQTQRANRVITVSLQIPKELKGIYHKKPTDVLQLLLLIAEGARPSDAHRAYCYAMALEGHPVVAARLASIGADAGYDKVVKGKETVRTIHVGHIRKAIHYLKEREKGARNKLRGQDS